MHTVWAPAAVGNVGFTVLLDLRFGELLGQHSNGQQFLHDQFGQSGAIASYHELDVVQVHINNFSLVSIFL